MARRTITVCDYCKEEAELEATINIKKANKKNRSYDICAVCAETLERRLVSSEKPVNKVPAARSQAIEEDENVISLDDGSTRPIPQPRPERETPEVELPGPDEDRELPQSLNKDGNPCTHMNRTAPRIHDNKPQVRCRDCGVYLPFVSARQNQQRLSVKPID